MSAFRTSNPLFTAPHFSGGASSRRFGDDVLGEAARPGTMTLQGTVNVTFILLGLTVAAGVAAYSFIQQSPELLMPLWAVGTLLGLVLTVIVGFAPKASPWLGPVIAVCEGLFAGAVSVFWAQYAAGSRSQTVGLLGTGIIVQASILTAGVAGSLLLAYKSRLIRATENFKLGVIAATGGLCFLVVASLVLSLFGVHIPYIWGNGPIGIGFAGVVVVLAALNLVLDFDFIEQGSRQGLPKHMEWYAGIGVLVTLVWLYVSILRLLAKLQRRD